ncbi:SEC10/PgrA surface exclusion domain-containing protein [Lactobacillus sp. Marseille-P7033]|nr:SEC10/PgrA surface exclusion domain-containing protein [Lactobacillus sp. Marseille-P7033]
MNSKKKVLTGAIVAATVVTTAISVNDNKVHADEAVSANESSVTPVTQAQQIVNEKEDAVNSAQNSVKDAQNKVDQSNSAQQIAQDNYSQANNAVQYQQKAVDSIRQQLDQDQGSAEKTQEKVSNTQKKVNEIKNGQSNKSQLEKEANQAEKDLAVIKDENKNNQLAKEVTDAQSNLTNVEIKQKEAQSNLENAKNNANKASNDLTNAQNKGNKSVTQAEIDIARNKLDEAQKAKESADKNVVIAQGIVNKAEQEVNAKKAALNNVSTDWTTRGLIDAPDGYKKFFGKQGLMPYLRQVLNNQHNPDSGVTFMPEKYAGERSSIQQLKAFANSFKNSSANDGTQDLVFIYTTDNKVIITDNVDNVPLDADQPITVWYRNLSNKVDNVSKVMQTPTEVYYEYSPDHQDGMIAVKNWNDLPENKKAEAIVKYANNYNYTALNPSENVAITDAIHLDPAIQQKLTEYAVNLMNHFNETAGYPGQVVANNVAIQKANYVAEHQQSPTNHDLYASQVGADAEDMFLGRGTNIDPSSTDLDQLRESIFDGIGEMLFPRYQEGDWEHGDRILKGGYMYPGTVNQPAKFGLSFAKFGNLHLLWFPASDADFKNSTDYVAKGISDISTLQNELDNANKVLITAQSNLKRSKDTQVTAARNLTAAQQKFITMQNGIKVAELQKAKNDANQQLIQAQQQVDKANKEVAIAQQALSDVQDKLSMWTSKNQAAEQRVAKVQQALSNISDSSILINVQQTLEGAQKQLEHYNKLVNDDTVTLDQAQKVLNDLWVKANNAKDKLNSANSAVTAAKRVLNTANSNLITAQNELQQAKGHLATIQSVHGNDNIPSKVNSSSSVPTATITLHSGVQSIVDQQSTVAYDENGKVSLGPKALVQNTEQQEERHNGNYQINETTNGADARSQLPQTGSVDSSSLFALGLVTLAGMFGLGFRKRNI